MSFSPRRFLSNFQPPLHVKSSISTFLMAALLLFSLSQAAKAQSNLPVIERQPYRILYNTDHDPVGEWPPIGINPPRVDASSLVNLGCAIDLRIVATGNNLTYQWKKSGVNIPGATNSQLFVNVTSLLDAGRYQCEVKNLFGAVLSLPVRMGVVDISPSDRIIAASATAKVTLATSFRFPTTSGGFKYQWFKMLGATPDLNTDVMLANDLTYGGATTPSLEIKAPSVAPAGSYYCRITAYNTFMISGLRNLAIVSSPEPAMVQQGSPLQFSVTPTGPASVINNLSYQWNKAGVAIPEATDSSFIIGTAEIADAGLYSLTVIHPTLGSVTTPSVAAFVVDPPVSRVAVTGGMRAVLAAPPALNRAQTYQWFRDGSPLVDGGRITNATAASLTIALAQAADAGEYECRGTLFGDTVVVARPVLIVTPAPQSKVIALGETLQLEVQPEYGGSNFVDPALFGFQWVKGTGTTATVLAGETNSTLTIASTTAADFGQFNCRVSYNGSPPLATPSANVAIVNTALQVVNVNAGRSATLSPLVFAPRGLLFQWNFQGAPLLNSAKHAGVTSSRLAVNTASVADAGIYECEMSFAGGTSATAPVQLVVYSRPEIVNLEFPPAIVGGVFNYAITVSNDPLYAATGYDAASLPRGLVINKSTGVISGIPSASGTFNILVSARNAVGTTTQPATLTVSSLPSRFVGRFVAALPRMPAGEFGALGGRLDMTIASTGTTSGSLTVGGTRLAFKGSIAVAGTDPLTATATATINVERSGGNLSLSFNLQDDDYLYDGQISGAGNTLNFSGWRAVYTVAQPPSALAGVYNIGLFPQEPDAPALPHPEGTGYATLSISGSPTSDLAAGNYSMVTLLPDDTAFTTAAFVGPAGELLAYGYLYGTAGGGSVVSSGTSLNINALAAGKPVTGNLDWSRPATATRRYKEGFGPLTLSASGGLYTAGPRLLAAESAELTFEGGGIELAALNPNAVFTIGMGTALPVRTAPNAALTAFRAVAPISGLFNGSFVLADDNPTTPLANPTEYRRTVNFKGLAVPINGTQVGVGFFILPQIPTSNPLTTRSNSPELSGSVFFDPVLN